MFVKRGDSVPISDILNDDGEKEHCKRCGKELVTFSVDGEITPICECEVAGDDE